MRILCRGGQLMLTECINKKGSTPNFHSHPHEQMVYVVEGKLRLHSGAEETILNKGDSAYLGPNVTHGVATLEDSVWLDVFTPQREDFLKAQVS